MIHIVCGRIYLLNIFLADLFFAWSNAEISNYTDDTTPYAVSDR